MNDKEKLENASFDNKAMSNLLRTMSHREYRTLLCCAIDVFCDGKKMEALDAFRKTANSLEERYAVRFLHPDAPDETVIRVVATLVYAVYVVEMWERQRKERGESS